MKEYKKLTIIIPTYNEHKTIAELVQYVEQVQYPIDYEIIIVDDASIHRRDDINLYLNKEHNPPSRLKVFKNEVNQGKGYSIRKGIQHASGDIIIVQDADTEYDPREIPRLLEPILKQQTRIVYGSRFLNSFWPKDMRPLSWMANRVLTWLTNVLFGLKLTDMETCYKAFVTDLLRELPLTADRFTFEPEVTALLAQRKVAIKELPISYRGRSRKEGKKIRAKDFLAAVGVLIQEKYGKRI